MNEIDSTPEGGSHSAQLVEDQLHVYENKLQQRHPLVFWLSLVLPAAMILGALVALLIFKGVLFTAKLVAAAAVTFVFLGRLVILLGQQNPEQLDFDIFLTPNQLFFMVSYLDLAAAILVAFHVGLLFDLPVVGKRATALIDDAKFVMNRFPTIQQAAFLGLTGFVAFPLAATGAIGGSILGTLLGLSRIQVFVATIIGCLIGNSLMLKFSELMEPLTRNPWIKYSSLVAIIALVILMEWRYRKSKEKYHQIHPDIN
jgi:uncharacterized membrane protein